MDLLQREHPEILAGIAYGWGMEKIVTRYIVGLRCVTSSKVTVDSLSEVVYMRSRLLGLLNWMTLAFV